MKSGSTIVELFYSYLFILTYFNHKFMVNTKFKANNSLFGKELCEVLRSNNITATTLFKHCPMNKGYFYAIKRGLVISA